MKRMRGRSHRSGGGGGGSSRSYNGNIPLNRNHVFDSTGPDLRIRGTAQQLFEKYLQLGRDATGAGDRVMAESYFQHADHYFRIVNAINQAQQSQQGHYQGAPQGGHQGNYQGGQQAGGHQGGPHAGHSQQAGGQNRDRRGQQDDDQPEDDGQGYAEQPLVESRDIPIAAAQD